MINAYSLIIGLFILGGIVSMAWGWRTIRDARKSLRWPHTQGVIERAEAASEADDLLPHIEFSFCLDSEYYRHTFEFPAGTTPSQELSNSYLQKYPAQKEVTVYYHPQDRALATLEPGPAKGDWLIFAFGLGAMVLGIVMLVVA